MALPVRPGRQERVSPRDPYAELGAIYDRIGKLWESAVSDAASLGVWSPFADVEETDDAYVVEVELPGVKEDEIDIRISDAELTISGEVQQKQRSGVLRRQTRRTGSFAYSVSLPSEVEQEGVSALLDKGVLKVRLPKTASSRPRRIPVSTSA